MNAVGFVHQNVTELVMKSLESATNVRQGIPDRPVRQRVLDSVEDQAVTKQREDVTNVRTDFGVRTAPKHVPKNVIITVKEKPDSASFAIADIFSITRPV